MVTIRRRAQAARARPRGARRGERRPPVGHRQPDRAAAAQQHGVVRRNRRGDVHHLSGTVALPDFLDLGRETPELERVEHDVNLAGLLRGRCGRRLRPAPPQPWTEPTLSYAGAAVEPPRTHLTKPGADDQGMRVGSRRMTTSAATKIR